MPMRTDCKHYESRTYASGEIVRKCRLDLAPEAPWRCPDDCPAFVKRRFDAGWHFGSLADAAAPPDRSEPVGDDVVALLDAAEDIVNSAAPDIIAEVDGRRKKKMKKGRRRKKK